MWVRVAKCVAAPHLVVATRTRDNRGMSRRVVVAALVMVLSGALAACFSTPGFQSGDDDSAHGSGVDASENADAGLDAAKIYSDGPTVYNDAPKYYMDGPLPCVAGKPGSVICSNM